MRSCECARAARGYFIEALSCASAICCSGVIGRRRGAGAGAASGALAGAGRVLGAVPGGVFAEERIVLARADCAAFSACDGVDAGGLAGAAAVALLLSVA